LLFSAVIFPAARIFWTVSFLRAGGLRMRTFVYVDGFNLYYGAVKGTPYKWLNLVDLARQVLPASHTVASVKYFTARVSGAEDPDSPKRQHAYLSALQTLPEVEIAYGRFLSKTIWRPVTNFPVAGAQIHSPTLVSLPAGNHNVKGGSLAVPATLAVDVYPQVGTRSGIKTPKGSDSLRRRGFSPPPATSIPRW
jgi:hypothetical protein